MIVRKRRTHFYHMRLRLFYCFLLITAVIKFPKQSKAFTSYWSPSKVSTQSDWDRRIFHHRCQKPQVLSLSSLVLPVSKLSDAGTSTSTSLNDDDKKLLRETKKENIVQLCKQFNLPVNGTKEELLILLRSHAEERIEEERQSLENRKKRVEDGGGENDREKYEIINAGDEEEEQDDDSDAYFYFETQEVFPDFEDNSKKEGDDHESMKKSQQRSENRPVTRESLTAPPPPPGVEPNEDGERVVTVYSTSDQNDLTGVAAAQPGQAAAQDSMTGSVVAPENAPWDFHKHQNNPNRNQKSEASEAELEAAKTEVTELIQSLLAMTGAPGFAYNDDDEYDDENNDNSVLSTVGIFRQKTSPSSSIPSSSFAAPGGFIGFDPTKVSTTTLSKASQNIRMGRGSILADVTREFEMRAVGFDGAFGDNEKRGGGHYRQVSLVRSFLEGYRRAEVRRLARGTATMLLDRLVTDGIEGLDSTLSIMTRVGDDTNQEAGELNDSLLDYLNDAIRQQERKVEQMMNSAKKVEELERSIESSNTLEDFDEDQLEKLWTVGNEDGKRVETFDPKDPKSKIALQDEYERAHKDQEKAIKQALLPKSAQEKLLLLLKLLRERVKIEAAFSHDEKSRNLRVLAYCLNLKSDQLQKELIVKEFGSSLDRLDSFEELVSSSIEYGESTSYQVQPSKVVTLNVPLLERILVTTKEIIEQQSFTASTGKTTGIQ